MKTQITLLAFALQFLYTRYVWVIHDLWKLYSVIVLLLLLVLLLLEHVMLCGAIHPNAQPPKRSSNTCLYIAVVLAGLFVSTKPCTLTSTSIVPFHHPLVCQLAFALLEFSYALQLCHSLISQPVKQLVSRVSHMFVCFYVCWPQSCSGQESTLKKVKHNKCANFI